MKEITRESFNQLTGEMEKAMQKVILESMNLHRFLGKPIAVSIDGEVVVGQVDEIIELQRKSEEKKCQQNQQSQELQPV